MERVHVTITGERTLSSAAKPAQLALKAQVTDVGISLSAPQLKMCGQVWKGLTTAHKQVDAHESSMADYDTDAGDDDNFVDASDVEPWLMRSTLNIVLECSSMNLTLKRCGPKGISDVAFLNIAEVVSEYTTSMRGIESNLAIRSISMLEPGFTSSDKMCFLSSTSSSPNEHLVKVKYELVAKERRLDRPEYDSCLDLVFNKMELNWNDVTVAALMLYAQEAHEEIQGALPVVARSESNDFSFFRSRETSQNSAELFSDQGNSFDSKKTASLDGAKDRGASKAKD